MAHAHGPIKQISDIRPGDHLCCIYSTDEEHREVLTRFLLDGLKNHEKVFYIVDARTAETIMGYLKDAGLDVDSYLRTGQFSILTVSDSYMKDGVFDPDRMIALLSTETENALQEGYSALRVTGEMSWALGGLPGSERLIEYEHKLNTFFPGSRCVAVCQYDRRRFDQDILLHVLMTHPFAFIGEHLYENFYFTPPEEFLDPNREKTTLDRWISNLKDRKEAEEALRRSEERFRALFDHMLEGFALCRMIYDEGGRPVDWEYLEVNPAFGRLTGLRDIAGKKVSEAIPGTKEQTPEIFEIYGRVATTGRPETFDVFFTPLRIWLHISVSCPQKGYFVAVFQDITSQKESEESLRKSEETFRSYIENAPDGIFLADAEGNYLMVNEAACAITGYSKTELVGKNIRDLIPPGDQQIAFAHFRQVKEEGQATGETRYVTKSGEVRYWLVKAVRIDDQRLLGFTSDITDRKMMESEIRSLNTVLEQKVEERTHALADTNVALEEEITRRREMEDQIRAALNEKTLLLREVHHRVKNNLQIIISLSNLQLRQIEDPKMRQVMAETQNRVRAMALVHEKLYKSETLSDIDLAEYVRFLTSQLFAYYETDSRKVTLKTEIGKITLPINTAIPLGLIINELVSNALKHAFPDGRAGSLFILARREDKTINLVVEDTGICIPADLEWRNTQSLGLKLVISLVNQLDGTIDLDRTRGTAFTMVLKVKE